MAPLDVIYIEDDETEGLLMQFGLEARGIGVLHLSDASPAGLSALETPRYRAARAVFFDLWIRTVNGIEVARWLREVGDTRPFFLVTAAENPDPALLQSLNIVFLRKPLDYQKLAERIQALAG